jgi:putative ABC transport system permease protein
MGKIINIHYVGDELEDPNLKVTGVVKAWPANTHFDFKYIISQDKNPDNRWWPYVVPIVYTYITLPKEFSPKDLELKFPEVVKKYYAPEIEKKYSTKFEDWNEIDGYWRFGLQPLKHIHLDKLGYKEHKMIRKGNMFHVQIYTIIALFIIVLAIINFITLSTARSEARAKEVGVRKANGATRGQLIWQFLTESTLLSIIALIFAFILVSIFSKSFNDLLEIKTAHSFVGIVFVLLSTFIFTIIIGLIAGSYPAFFFSSYEPVNVLKRQPLEKIKGMTIRNSLVVFQFMFSMVLIISSIFVYKQLVYIQNKDLGFEKENIIIIKDLISLYYEDSKMSHEGRELQFATLRQELIKLPGVINASLAATMPGNYERNFNISIHPEGASPETKFGIPYTKIDYAYLDVFGLEIIAGKNFSKNLTIPQTMEGVIINEKAADLFGLKDPVGKFIEAEMDKRIVTEEGKKKWVREVEQIPIIGVFKDFHTRDLHEDLISTVFFPQYHDGYFGFFMAVRLSPDNISSNINLLEKTWKATGTNLPFKYSFFDKELENQYSKEKKLVQIITFFTILSILIACLGIFGLVSLTAEQRTKEIGIRKVNGASTKEILYMLNKDFVKWVFLAFIIASPIAYYVMYKWLQNFVYKTNLSWWVFLLTFGITLLVALLTVRWQSYSAAKRNPVEALRDE